MQKVKRKGETDQGEGYKSIKRRESSHTGDRDDAAKKKKKRHRTSSALSRGKLMLRDNDERYA
jgi:hypothetical protein